MTDEIKHECGIGLIRLLKSPAYYKAKYGSSLWGLNKMYLLMEKQHNRGQDGAGLACVKLNVAQGKPYLQRIRNNQPSPWISLFKKIEKKLTKLRLESPEMFQHANALYEAFPFAGELLLGHLRYATHGNNSLEACHPVVRSNNWPARSLVAAGNFNLTNVGELFQQLVDLGQHPRYFSDTETVLERIGHFLDQENEVLFDKFKAKGLDNKEISAKIATELDIRQILHNAAKKWDGGYVMGGLVGCGHAFVARDPNGIRPAYYYQNEELVVVASERPAISTVFNLPYNEIKELKPGHVFAIYADGKTYEKPFTEPLRQTSCTFERIYFSRGNDPQIYKERHSLGKLIVPKILDAIQYDLNNTVFSYIPNTAETAFWGMIKEVEAYMNNQKVSQLLALEDKNNQEAVEQIIHAHPRVEKVVIKDIKLRTFITDDAHRDDLVAHVYDITGEVLRPGKDNFVCIDDSIVRGTTLKKSILSILSRLKPKQIIIVSSAPQIRYPDCYGIDMSQIDRFIAFQAAIALLKDRGMENVIAESYQACVAMKREGLLHTKNVVKAIYAPFTEEEVSRKIAELLKPDELKCELKIVYQPLSNLPTAIPHHKGDWYFSGNYPTPGGNRVVNQAFINYIEGKKARAY